MPDMLDPAPKTRATTIGSALLTGFHCLVVLVVLLICVGGYLLGALYNILALLVFILPGVGAVSRAAGALAKSLELGFIRRPFNRTFRKYLLQCLNQWLFLILALVTLRLAIVPVQFSRAEYRTIQFALLGATALSMVFALIPHRRVRISVNAFFVVGWLFLGCQLVRIFLPPPAAQCVVIDAPFRGEWYVFQGGRGCMINHHYQIRAQRHALDLTKTKDGRQVQADQATLQSYPAYGQALYAPADGRIAKIVNDRPDMPVGQTDLDQIVGNQVVVDIGHERFVLLAHLKRGSVCVSSGQQVRRGQKLAECGNSGNTSEPHIHLQVQSRAEFDAGDLRTFPILFRDVARVRSGQRKQLQEADVRANDILIAPDSQ